MSIDPSDVSRRARDRALVESHCAGDPHAFPFIVRTHYAPLLAKAQRRLGSRVEAEDAVQETFERAYRGLCRLNGDYRIAAWLHRILANVCIDHAARRNVQRALPDRIGTRSGDVPDAAEHASDPFVFAAVQAALAALPASQRQTFWLHEMDGLSYPEVAEHLGISEDNARARVHRAKAALRASLTRARVAAALVIPAGIRVRFRRPGPSGAAASPAAYSWTSAPVAELAATSAAGGGRMFVVVATSVATAVGGLIAAPTITGQSASSNAPPAAVAAPAVADVGTRLSIDEDLVGDALAAVVTTVPPTATTGPARASSGTDGGWVAAAASALEGQSDEPAPEDALPDGEAAPGPTACGWVDDHPGILTPPSAPSAVTGSFERVERVVGAGANLTWWADTTLLVAQAAGGPVEVATTFTLRTQVCLERGRAAMVVDAEALDGQRARLLGGRVLRLSDQVSVFRGRVVVPPDAPNAVLPWRLPERFVARLEIDASGTARLDVVFLGEPSIGAPPTTAPGLPAAEPAPEVPPTTTPEAPPEPEPTTTTTAPADPSPPDDGGTPPATEPGSS